MSAKYVKINLEDIVEKYGEDRAKSILADFSCELNKDVDNFIKTKAIEFSKQSIAKTQLVYYIEDEENPITSKKLVGYFSLTQKTINVSKKALSNKLSSRIRRFATYNKDEKTFTLPVILIGQLGKNYKDGNDRYLTGKDFLGLAMESISFVQRMIGGKFIFLECEDKDVLKKFYSDNGFFEFGKRKLDGDETDKLDGKYLLQWICYPK